MCGNYRDSRQSVDCMGCLQSTDWRWNFRLILEDVRMARPFGPRFPGKLYENENCWIQAMMDFLLAISDEWLVLNMAKWISIYMYNTNLRPPIELFRKYAFQFLGTPDAPSGNPVWEILLYAKAMLSNIHTTERTLRVATVCGTTSSSARTRSLILQTATICIK